MKNLFIIGNWKSNKSEHEAREWLRSEAIDKNREASWLHKKVILCPPFALLSGMKQVIDEEKLSISLGSQDFSPFEAGAHTGEEPPELVKDFVSYAIIGHSERRRELGETDERIAEKITVANAHGITPILCVQGKKTPVPADVSIVAYEPIFAIGSGHPDTPDNAESVISEIKAKHPQVKYALYGGSVTPENVQSFTQMPSIDGVLVGGASLDAEKFMEIITNA